MNTGLNRRTFLKRTALAAGAVSAAPNLLAARSPSDLLNCVLIGCGGRGMTHLNRHMLSYLMLMLRKATYLFCIEAFSFQSGKD